MISTRAFTGKMNYDTAPERLPRGDYWKSLQMEDFEGEVWKEIEGYEDLYEVSSLGRVKSVQKLVQRNSGYWMKPAMILRQKVTKGYLTAALCKNAIMKHKKVHILVATAFIANPENKATVNHKWGIKTDNRATELEWATNRENIKHAYDIGIKEGMKGEKHPRAKLRDTDVVEIRRLRLGEKRALKEIAKMYNISFALVSSIALGKNYSHVP